MKQPPSFEKLGNKNAIKPKIGDPHGNIVLKACSKCSKTQFQTIAI